MKYFRTILRDYFSVVFRTKERAVDKTLQLK